MMIYSVISLLLGCCRRFTEEVVNLKAVCEVYGNMFQLQLQFAAISAAVCCLLSTGLAQDSKCFRQFVFDYCLVE